MAQRKHLQVFLLVNQECEVAIALFLNLVESNGLGHKFLQAFLREYLTVLEQFFESR